MEQEDLKRKLVGLWEKTTHNSKEMITSLFNNYYDSELIEYKETDGKIVVALCGIPYNFGYGPNPLKGLYIIPLSSEEGFKKKGMLSELLRRFNDRMADKYDFTFLVPQNELMADYLGTQGYLSSFFVLEERFTSAHDFKNDYTLSLTDSNERLRTLKLALFDSLSVLPVSEENSISSEHIIEFILDIENKGGSSINLRHTENDLRYLLNEGLQQNIVAYVSYDSDNRISGVVFIAKEDLKHIRVLATFVMDTCSYFVLLDRIKHEYPEFSFSVITSDPRFQMQSLIQQVYAGANPAGGDLDNTIDKIQTPVNITKLLQPLGMVKLLRYDNILAYLAERRNELDIKLLIREQGVNSDENRIFQEPELFIVKNGNIVKEPYKGTNDKGILNLSKYELSELLLRKKDSSNLIMEAFGIPSLNLQISLLPYKNN